MIKSPKKGMKVNVDDAECCCGVGREENHTGQGKIVEVDTPNSFRVKMDDHDEAWWRCKDCVTEIV